MPAFWAEGDGFLENKRPERGRVVTGKVQNFSRAPQSPTMRLLLVHREENSGLHNTLCPRELQLILSCQEEVGKATLARQGEGRRC